MDDAASSGVEWQKRQNDFSPIPQKNAEHTDLDHVFLGATCQVVCMENRFAAEWRLCRERNQQRGRRRQLVAAKIKRALAANVARQASAR